MARATDAGGLDSDPSADFVVAVDPSGPEVESFAPEYTESLTPEVTVTARDPFGVWPGSTVTLDVDLNGDGDYVDAGEAGYARGYLGGKKAALEWFLPGGEGPPWR